MFTSSSFRIGEAGNRRKEALHYAEDDGACQPFNGHSGHLGHFLYIAVVLVMHVCALGFIGITWVPGRVEDHRY